MDAPSPVKILTPSQAGFSFIEFLVVIAIMATVYAVALPNLNIIGSSAIESKMDRLASDIRGAFDMSVLKNKPYRIVFMMMSGDYWLETTDRLDFKLGDHILGRDLTEPEERDLKENFESDFAEYVDLAGSEIDDGDNERVLPPASPVVKAKEKLRPVEWTKVKDAEWTTRNLGPELIIQDMKASHHDRKQTFEEMREEARGIIYFFPGGYVEPAFIHIAYRKGEFEFSETDKPYTVITKPIEGVAEIESGYEEIELNEKFKK